MSKYKLGQKITISRDNFTDHQPRKALICMVKTELVNGGLISFGLDDFKRTGDTITSYAIVREHRNGVTDKLLFDDRYHEDDFTPGWSKDAV